METKEMIEQIINTLIDKKVIPSDAGVYFSIDGLQQRYNEKSLDKRTLKAMSEENGFPLPIQLSKNKIVWIKEEVISWEEERKSERVDTQRLGCVTKSNTGVKSAKSISA